MHLRPLKCVRSLLCLRCLHLLQAPQKHSLHLVATLPLLKWQRLGQQQPQQQQPQQEQPQQLARARQELALAEEEEALARAREDALEAKDLAKGSL